MGARLEIAVIARWVENQSPVSMLMWPGSVNAAGLKAFSNSTPSAASASIVGDVGRSAPYAPTLRARSVSIETSTTSNGRTGRTRGARTIGSPNTASVPYASALPGCVTKRSRIVRPANPASETRCGCQTASVARYEPCQIRRLASPSSTLTRA